MQSFTRRAGLRSDQGLKPSGMGTLGPGWTSLVGSLAEGRGCHQRIVNTSRFVLKFHRSFYPAQIHHLPRRSA